MNALQDARRAELMLIYNGKDVTKSLSASLLQCSYTDAKSGELDRLHISLQDRERLWQGDWQPNEGDIIKAEIRVLNWTKPNESKTLPCGTFSVDSFGFSGPPDTVTIEALSLPGQTTVRQEERTKAWENVKLSTLAKEVAKRANLKLFYDTKNDPSYERIEQQQKSDLLFLMETAIKEGIAIKVSSGTLILFDEEKFEQQEPVLDIVRGKSNILTYKFNWNTVDAAYVACENSYEDTKAKKTVTVAYRPPKAPKTGPVLRISERADSEVAALRLCKARLRERNKAAHTASFTLVGDIRLASSSTINVVGWGRFDGKYIIESANHEVSGSGYIVHLETRKVLGW